MIYVNHHLKGVDVNSSLYLPFGRGEGKEFKPWEKLTLFREAGDEKPVTGMVAAIDPLRREIFIKPDWGQKENGIVPGWYQLCTLRMLNKKEKKPLLGIGKNIEAMIKGDDDLLPRRLEITALDYEGGKIKLKPHYPTSTLLEKWWNIHDVRILKNLDKSSTAITKVTTKPFNPNQSWNKWAVFMPPKARPQRFKDNLVNGVAVRDWFTEFTKFTTPMGTEHQAYHDFFMRQGMNMCINSLNYYRIIPILEKDEEGNVHEVMPTTMFVAHMDTADSGKEMRKVNHVFREDWVMTDQTTLLGGDDKAGMTVLYYLMCQKVPGFYLFVWGEERGRKGSIDFEKHWNMSELGIKRCIAFDRRGNDEIITKQNGTRGCSEDFTNALITAFKGQEMKFRASTYGSFTDSYTFFNTIPECTNIAAGYEAPHGTSERQNLAFLEDLCYAAGNIDWESLPTVQDVSVRREVVVHRPASKSGQAASSRPATEDKNIQEALAEWGYASGSDADNPAGAAWNDLIDARVLGELSYQDVGMFLYDFPEEATDLLYKFISLFPNHAMKLSPPATYIKNSHSYSKKDWH